MTNELITADEIAELRRLCNERGGAISMAEDLNETLTMAEALPRCLDEIEWLQREIEHIKGQWDTDDIIADHSRIELENLDLKARVAELEEAQRWRPATELPPSSGPQCLYSDYVLVHYPAGGCNVTCFNILYKTWVGPEPAGWMPLPSAPQTPPAPTQGLPAQTDDWI